MTYTQYTIKRQKRLAVLYRCSHCDKNVLQMVSLHVNATYNDKGTFTRAGVEKRAARADAMGAEAMDERQYALKAGRDSSVFAKAQLKAACPHCGKREPWALMNVDWMDSVAILAVLVALFFYVMMENTTNALIALGVAAGVFLLRLCWQGLMRSRIETQMVKCPPLFDDDLENLQKRAQRIECYMNADWAALMEGFARSLKESK